MRKWEVVLAILAVLVLVACASFMRRNELPHHDSIVISGDCHMPVTILEPRGRPRGTALILHGLAADRRIMEPLGDYLTKEQNLRSYLFDLAGHGDNTDPFSFPRVDGCARVIVESLIRSSEVDPRRTILVAHSMGGAIAIRTADRDPVAATIAISPAPMPLPRRMPANLLVFSAQFDLPMLKRASQALAQAAGGERTQPDDFREARAFHLDVTSFSDHTSLLTDPRVFRQIGDWVDSTLGSANPSLRQRPLDYSYFYADLVPLVGVLAILLLFPFCATIAAKLAGPSIAEDSISARSVKLTLAAGAVFSLATALLLSVRIPLPFVRLYTGDYLASALLIFGALFLALNWKSVAPSFRINPKSLLVAAALGFAFMLGIGALLNWQTADLWLNGSRWQRFVLLLPVMLIFSFAEEVALGPVGHGRKRGARFALSIALRAELWLACLLTYYALASGEVLILILVASLALFSILQRLAIDSLRVRTGSPTAAALFGAILAAWFVAAVFPLT